MKQKHIVVLTGSYYPNFSAVGICAAKVVDELKKEARITVVSQKTDINEKEEVAYGGYLIKRVSTKLDNTRIGAIKKREEGSGVVRFYYLILINIIRIINYLKAISGKVNIKGRQVDAFVNALCKVNKEHPIDAVICCSFPFESVLAGIEYKRLHNDVKVIPYLFDNFVERDGLHRAAWNTRMKWSRHLGLVKKVLEESDSVFAMHSLRRHFSMYYKEGLDKIVYVEHPLLIRKEKDVKQANETANLVYAGSFLKNYVEPYFLINVLNEVLKRTVVDVDFYVMGNCVKCIDVLASRFPVSVKNHGKVAFEIADRAILDSDILLCVAERSGIQVSSKIFTYMSVGKPIILFYENENDINKSILSRYPLALFVNQKSGTVGEVAGYIIDFIGRNKCNELNFSEVRLLYPDAEPAFTAKKMFAALE